MNTWQKLIIGGNLILSLFGFTHTVQAQAIDYCNTHTDQNPSKEVVKIDKGVTAAVHVGRSNTQGSEA